MLILFFSGRMAPFPSGVVFFSFPNSALPVHLQDDEYSQLADVGPPVTQPQSLTPIS